MGRGTLIEKNLAYHATAIFYDVTTYTFLSWIFEPLLSSLNVNAKAIPLGMFSMVFGHRRACCEHCLPYCCMPKEYYFFVDRLDFSALPQTLETPKPDHAVEDRKALTLTNCSERTLQWKIDTKRAANFLEDASFV